MPDQDIIDRNVPRGWRTPVRLFTGSATERQVAKAIVQALARSLRENGGMPGSDRWVDLLRKRISGERDPHSTYTRADVIEQQLRHSRHAKVAGRAVKTLLVDADRLSLHGPNLERTLMEEFLWKLSDHAFFGRLRPQVVGQKRFRRIADLDKRVRGCRYALESSLSKLAARLAENPEAEELRAPRIRTGAPKSTETILDQPLT